jgi:hypothetical protein
MILKTGLPEFDPQESSFSPRHLSLEGKIKVVTFSTNSRHREANQHHLGMMYRRKAIFAYWEQRFKRI